MGGAKDSSAPTIPEEDLRQHTVESVVHGHHVYKDVWRPFVRQRLCSHQAEINAHDKCAVSLIKDEAIIGCELSRAFWHFIAHGGTITCEITGQRKHGKGLEVPWVYSFSGRLNVR